MKISARLLVGAVLLLTGWIGGAAWASAQGFVASQPVIPPVVQSGADIGFRITARKGDIPVGRLVVRVDGEWKEVEFTSGVKLITK